MSFTKQKYAIILRTAKDAGLLKKVLLSNDKVNNNSWFKSYDIITTCRYVVGIAESVTFIYARIKNSRM